MPYHIPENTKLYDAIDAQLNSLEEKLDRLLEETAACTDMLPIIEEGF